MAESKIAKATDEPLIMGYTLTDREVRKIGRSYVHRDKLNEEKNRLLAALRATDVEDKAFTKKTNEIQEDLKDRLRRYAANKEVHNKHNKDLDKKIKKADNAHIKAEIKYKKMSEATKTLQKNIIDILDDLSGMDNDWKKDMEKLEKTKHQVKQTKDLMDKNLEQVNLDDRSIRVLLDTWMTVGQDAGDHLDEQKKKSSHAVNTWLSLWPTLQVALGSESPAIDAVKDISILQGRLSQWWALHAAAVDVDSITQMTSDHMLATSKTDYTDIFVKYKEKLKDRIREAKQEIKEEKDTITSLERRSRLIREMTVALAHSLDQDAIRASQALDEVAKRPLTYYMEEEERNYEKRRQAQYQNNTGNMLAQKLTDSLDDSPFYGSNSMEMTTYFDGGGQVRLGPGETFEDFANNNFLLKEQKEIMKIQSATDYTMQRILQNREEITSAHKNKDNNDTTFGSSIESSQLEDWGIESSDIPPNKMASDIANRILSRLVLRGDRDGNAGLLEHELQWMRDMLQSSNPAILTDLFQGTPDNPLNQRVKKGKGKDSKLSVAERAARDSALAVACMETRRAMASLEIGSTSRAFDALTAVANNLPANAAAHSMGLGDYAENVRAWQQNCIDNLHAAVAMDTAYPAAPSWIAGKTRDALGKMDGLQKALAAAINIRRNSIKRLNHTIPEEEKDANIEKLFLLRRKNPDLLTPSEVQELQTAEAKMREKRNVQTTLPGGLRYPFMSALVTGDKKKFELDKLETYMNAIPESDKSDSLTMVSFSSDGSINDKSIDGTTRVKAKDAFTSMLPTPYSLRKSGSKSGAELLRQQVKEEEAKHAELMTKIQLKRDIQAKKRIEKGHEGKRKASIFLPNYTAPSGRAEYKIDNTFGSLANLGGAAGNVQVESTIKRRASQAAVGFDMNATIGAKADALREKKNSALVKKGTTEWGKLKQAVSLHDENLQDHVVEEEEHKDIEDNDDDIASTMTEDTVHVERINANKVFEALLRVTKPEEAPGIEVALQDNKASYHHHRKQSMVTLVSSAVADKEIQLGQYVGKLPGRAALTINARLLWQPRSQRLHMILQTMIFSDEFSFFMTNFDLIALFSDYPDLQNADPKNNYLLSALIQRTAIETIPTKMVLRLLACAPYSEELAQTAEGFGLSGDNELNFGDSFVLEEDMEDFVQVATLRQPPSEYEARMGGAGRGKLFALAVGNHEMDSLREEFASKRASMRFNTDRLSEALGIRVMHN